MIEQGALAYEQTDAATIGTLIVHEVHRPGLVDLRGIGGRLDMQHRSQVTEALGFATALF